MTRALVLFSIMMLPSALVLSQKNDTVLLYDPYIDAEKQINTAIIQAQAENKHVLIQVGGNWCPWCIKIHQFMSEHQRIDSLIKADYVLIHVNYSKENKNPEIMDRLDYPQRFGFPVFVILNEEGTRIHTQNTAYLEKDEYYSEEKILGFLKDWNHRAVDPATYLMK